MRAYRNAQSATSIHFISGGIWHRPKWINVHRAQKTMSQQATRAGGSSSLPLLAHDDLCALQRAAAAEECNSASSSSSPLQSRKRSRRDGNEDQTFADCCRRVASLHRSADALAQELREKLAARKERLEEKRRAIEALTDEQLRLATEIRDGKTALQAMRAELLSMKHR
jgi:hypothetical protein